MTQHFDKYINAKGLNCPQPLLLVKQAIKALGVQQIIFIEATDPHTDLDLEVWCERFGHKMIKSDIHNDIHRFWIKKTVNQEANRPEESHKSVD